MLIKDGLEALTNWKTISNSIDRLNTLDLNLNDPAFTNSISKKNCYS